MWSLEMNRRSTLLARTSGIRESFLWQITSRRERLLTGLLILRLKSTIPAMPSLTMSGNFATGKKDMTTSGIHLDAPVPFHWSTKSMPVDYSLSISTIFAILCYLCIWHGKLGALFAMRSEGYLHHCIDDAP